MKVSLDHPDAIAIATEFAEKETENNDNSFDVDDTQTQSHSTNSQLTIRYLNTLQTTNNKQYYYMRVYEYPCMYLYV